MDEKNNNTPENDDFKPLDKEKIEIKAKQRIKERKAKAKAKRPEYKKKRVVVPAVTPVLLVLLGILAATHSTFFQSTDDAFVEGRLITVAPRVSGPVVNLLVDDNDDVTEGQLLVEIDPTDYEVKLHETEAKLAQAKAELNVTEKEVEKGEANVNQSFEDISSTQSKLDFAQKTTNATPQCINQELFQNRILKTARQNLRYHRLKIKLPMNVPKQRNTRLHPIRQKQNQ